MNKTFIIEPSCSPFGKHEVTVIGEVSKVMMSCGGGMGGCSWNEFGTITGDTKNDAFVTLTDAVSGETKQLNTRFIVTVETKKLVKVVTDVTPHVNYTKKVCKSAVQTTYYYIDLSDNAVGSCNRQSLHDNDWLNEHHRRIYSETIKK